MPPSDRQTEGDLLDDREVITAAQLEALRLTLEHPTVYVQRMVEHLSFLPSGGQSWTRELQVVLPTPASLDPEEDGDFIISLGMFSRRRFPDLSVSDCRGRSLNLLTRFQHGHCLAETSLYQYLTLDQRRRVGVAASLKDAGLASANDLAITDPYQSLYRGLVGFFTSVKGDVPAQPEDDLRSLLTALGTPGEEVEAGVGLLRSDLDLLRSVTQYLCWVRGKPGSVVRASATWTIPDGIRLRDPEALGTRLSNFYTRIGLGPINYDMFTPANAHAGSYYFTVEPPGESRVSYLDWGLDNSASGTEKDWICAHSSVHVHNGARLVDIDDDPPVVPRDLELVPEEREIAAGEREEIENSKIYAFFRLDLSDHWQVAFGAFLNIVFVWLAESGRLVSELGGTTTPWLLFTPAALVAYAAQQSRHYYSATTGWVRMIIWGYLVVNVGFLVSISFDLAGNGSFLDRHGVRDDVVSVVMVAASIVVLVLFAALGRTQERMVRRWFRAERGKDPSARSVDLYVKVARRYGNRVLGLGLTLLAAFAGLIVAGLTPDSDRHVAAHVDRAAHSIPIGELSAGGPAIVRPGP
jgi:hypothetical protein